MGNSIPLFVWRRVDGSSVAFVRCNRLHTRLPRVPGNYAKRLVNLRSFREILRFGIGGLINFSLSYGAYLLLLSFLIPQIAYTLAYVLGLIFSFAINARFVFRASFARDQLLRFPMVYAVQYFLGVGLITLLHNSFGVSAAVAGLASVVFGAVLSYLLLRQFVFRPGSNRNTKF
jgi:putative flippase GtrA